MKTFKKICRMEQKKLKKWLEKLLRAKYSEVVNADGFLYAKGSEDAPVLLTAHMDTVHKDKCVHIAIGKSEGKTYIKSPQGIGGDDRCGIWIIWMILCKTKYRPSILFCEDEEMGGVGSNKFVKTEYVKDLEKLKYLVELDRANSKDAVYYDCGNYDFMKYIEKITGYKEAYGSFSDIGHLSPACDKASVNLSCGYYKQHTLDEYVIYEEMFDTFKVVKKLLADSKNAEEYDYQEEVYSFWDTWKAKGYSFSDYYDDGYGYYGYSVKNKYDDDEDKNVIHTYEINFYDENYNEDVGVVEGRSLEEALGFFFMEHSTISYQNIIEYYEYIG